jgi:hypothetical protein
MTKTKIPKLSSLIKAKKFDWVNSDITDNLFETPKEIGTDFKLFHFDRYILSEDAISEMANEGFRPANAWELLSWKDWNDKDWVVALGSVGEVGGDRYVPCLVGDGSERDLDLGWWDDGWDADYRFLGVRNSSLGSSDALPSDSVSLALGYLETAEQAIQKAKLALTKRANE